MQMAHLCSAAVDWPLSHEEKKGCVLRLFERDVQAANVAIRCGEERLEALKAELETVHQRVTAETSVKALSETPQKPLSSKARLQRSPKDDGSKQAEEAAEKLRMAIASATAALRALEGQAFAAQEDQSESPRPTRARSEGPIEPVSILCKDRRHSRGRSTEEGSGLKRRVSFGKLPKHETSDSNVHSVEPEPEQFVSDRCPFSGQSEQSIASSGAWKPSNSLVQRLKQPEVESILQTTKQLGKQAPTGTEARKGSVPAASKVKSSGLDASVQRQRSSERPATSAGKQQSSTTPRGGAAVRAPEDEATLAAPRRVWRSSRN